MTPPGEPKYHGQRNKGLNNGLPGECPQKAPNWQKPSVLR